MSKAPRYRKLSLKAARRLFNKYAARKCTDEERDFFLHYACRLWAKTNYDGVVAAHKAEGRGHGTLDELADIMREMVEDGQIVIDFNQEADAFRFVPGIIAQARGSV